MEILFDRLFDIFSLDYMFSVIIASYLMIKMVDALNGERVVPTWTKRVITCIVGIVSFFVFQRYTDIQVQSLIPSYFAAIFIYDTAIKVIIRKFNIDYRK